MHSTRSHRALAAALFLATACGGTPPAAAPVPETLLRPWTTQPGDQIRVRVWREPELSGEVFVQNDGTATFPALGRISVGGLSADSLNSLLLARFRERIVDTPVDAVLIRPLPVIGSVRSPGVYPVEPTSTAVQVIARAGGTQGAEAFPRIQLLRRDGSRYTISPEQSLGGFNIQNGDALFVQDESWFLRNRNQLTVIAAIASITVSIVSVVVILGR